MLNVNIIVLGRVQGVGFRYRVKNMADELGLCGYVRNLPDGSVAIEIEGQDEAVEQFIAWCKESPGYSGVKQLEATKGKIRGCREFRAY